MTMRDEGYLLTGALSETWMALPSLLSLICFSWTLLERYLTLCTADHYRKIGKTATPSADDNSALERLSLSLTAEKWSPNVPN